MGHPVHFPKMKTVVVGAGIVGASIAYYLARRGAQVELFDEGSAPASGVTASAFGWINLINGEPSANYANYRIRREAIGEFQRLKAALPQALEDTRRGSLVWRNTAAETEALVREHQSAGAAVELVDAGTLAWWEPQLRDVPPCAAYSPDDIALDPASLTRTLLGAAISAGAEVRFDQRVVALQTAGNGVTGIVLADEIISADIVVLAAGTSINPLIAPLGLDIGLGSSPAVLLRYSASAPFLNRILCRPDLEIRQQSDNSLLVATGYPQGSGDDGLASIGQDMLDIMRRRLALPEGVELRQTEVGYRPVFGDGFPRLGFLPGLEGVYVAVAHPGVILAPLLGRLAMQELIEGQRSPLIPGFDVAALAYT